MKLFELRAEGPEAGDCTAPYYVDFYSECTVQEFIDEVLKKNEWGYIIIGRYFDGPRIEYKHDKIVSGAFSQDILDAKIKNATAHGGWTMMDYMLDIWTNEQKLRNEYTQTLKEIVRHESEIAKLKKKAHDLEDQLEKELNEQNEKDSDIV